MHTGWSLVWHAFHDTLVREPVAIQLAVWVGLALILVLALEGLRVSLAPSRFTRRHLHLHHAHYQAQRQTAEPLKRPEPVKAAAPAKPAAPVTASASKRVPPRVPRPRRVRVVIKKKSLAAPRKPVRRSDP